MITPLEYFGEEVRDKTPADEEVHGTEKKKRKRKKKRGKLKKNLQKAEKKARKAKQALKQQMALSAERELRHRVELELSCVKLLLKTQFPNGAEQLSLPGKEGDSYAWDLL